MNDDPPPRPETPDEKRRRELNVVKLDPGGGWRSHVGPDLAATPYVWTEPEMIAMRQWLYGRHLIRGAVSALVAPGGVGKSAFTIMQALAMVSGKDLLGGNPFGGGKLARVWLWNLEDPKDELTRRIQAAALRYELVASDLSDRLFVDVGSNHSLILATALRGDVRIDRYVSEGIVAEIRKQRIDVLTIDPFISSHRAGENDNQAIDLIVKEWARIADATACSVQLVHHTRKNGLEEITAESSRGAKAMIDACRSVQVINRMNKEEAEKSGIEEQHMRRYFRVVTDKANLSPPSEKAEWYRIESVELGNGTAEYPAGDSVGVVVPWEFPKPLDGITAADLLRVQEAIDGKGLRENSQAKDWIGHVIGEVLGIESGEPKGATRIRSMLKSWLKSGALVVVERLDEKRKPRPVVEVGKRNY